MRLFARLAIALGYAYALWFFVLFLPGNLSLDSLDQYEQAVTGVFNDHHPPVMAACLRLLMGLGLGLKTLIGLQVLAGVAGVHCLVRASSRLFERDRASGGALATAGAFVLLISPLTPLMFYLTTFWKDSWFAIALVWTTVSLAWLLVPGLTKLPGWLTACVFVGSAAASVLSRHNGIVLLPVSIALLLLHSWAGGRKRGALLALVTLAVALGSSQLIYAAFDVERRHVHENYVMFYDLVALCEIDGQGEGCADRLIAEAAAREEGAFQRRNPELWADWTRTLMAHPLALLQVKLGLFAGTLNLSKGPHDYFLARIYGGFNRYGLAWDPEGEETRRALTAFTNRIARLPALRFVLGSHVLWFLVSAFGSAWLVWRSWRARELDPRLGLFALPFAYYIAYLPIFTTGDFRYMYPATLVTQVCVVSWASEHLADAIDRRRSRAKSQ